MSQVMPYLGYPGGCSAFFTDLHLDFPRWLRLVALVPLVHASIEGLSYEELCFHLLGIFPSSNPQNVLIVSADRIRSSVADMLFKEPFFVCSLRDGGSSLSTSHWVYESSFDSDPSRISFAFNILRCINLSPGLSTHDTLSRLTSVAPPSLSISVSNESRGQQEPQSLYEGHSYSPLHSPPTAVVRVSIPLVVRQSAPPARAGLNSLNQQRSRLPSVLGSSITFDPPRPGGSLYLPHGSVLVPMGSTASGEIVHSDHVSSHLSRSHGHPRQFCGTPVQPATNPHVAEDIAADPTISTQHKAPTSDSPGHLNELPSQLSVGLCDPLFLPSQTPNRDPYQDIFSPQGSSLTHEGRRSLQGSPISCTGWPQPDCPRSDLLHTTAPRHVEIRVQSGFEGEIPLHDIRSLPARTFAAATGTLPLQWPNGPTTDACPQMLSMESNHGPPRYQSVGPSNAIGERGSVTHEAVLTGVPQARCNIEPSGTSAPKRPTTPVNDTAFDVPFSTPTAPERKTLTPSPLTSEHEELSLGDQRRTRPSNFPDNDLQIPHPDSDRTLQIPSSNSPQSGPRRPSTFLGTSRPSVIVYKVARGPNLSGSRDVIRVSYGEGHRKRTPLTNLSNGGDKDRTLGRQGCSKREYGNAKRDDTTEHLNRKPIRSKLCSARRYYDEKRSPSGLRRADMKMSGRLPPAERVEGDMAWDFGAGPETYVRPVDADRSRVRVGGLTSVRMIPRTAVNGGIGPEAASPTI